MRRFLILSTCATVAALALAASASAKGPDAASLKGPGLGGALAVQGDGEGGSGTPLGALVQLGGYFPQVFEEIPDPTTTARPKGDLGPRYQVLYRVPGPNGDSTIVQDVYPYAKPVPVTHMAAGERFWGGQRTHGGWFLADSRLKTALVHAGLPASPPARGSSTWPWAWTGVGLGAAAVILLLLLAVRGKPIVRFRTLKTTA